MGTTIQSRNKLTYIFLILKNFRYLVKQKTQVRQQAEKKKIICKCVMRSNEALGPYPTLTDEHLHISCRRWAVCWGKMNKRNCRSEDTRHKKRYWTKTSNYVIWKSICWTERPPPNPLFWPVPEFQQSNLYSPNNILENIFLKKLNHPRIKTYRDWRVRVFNRKAG